MCIRDRAEAAPLVAPFVLHAALAFAILLPVLLAPETASKKPLTKRSVLPSVPTRGRRLFFFVIVPAAIWVFGFPSTSFALFPVAVAEALPGNEVVIAAAMGFLTAWSALLSRPIVKRLGLRRSIPVGMALGVLGYVCGTIGFATSLWPMVLPAAVLLGAASGTLTAGPLGLSLIHISEPTRPY